MEKRREIIAPSFAGRLGILMRAPLSCLLMCCLLVICPSVVCGQAPTSGSVSPASGTGLSEAFTVTYTDSNGAADVLQAHLLFNTGLSGAYACWAIYYGGSFYLMNNDQSAWLGPLASSGGSLSNSQCTFYQSGTSINNSGNTFSMTVNVTFAAGFAGTKASFIDAVLPEESAPVGVNPAPGRFQGL